MDHEIELIPHCSPVAFKFAEFRGTHLWRGELPHDKGGDACHLNFGIWSHLGCPGQNAIIFSRKGLFQGCTRRNYKILIRFIYSIHVINV